MSVELSIGRTAPLNAARVATACGVASFLSLPTLLIYPFSIFAIAIAQDGPMSKQQVAALLGPALLLNIVTQPIVGWIVQRFHKPTVAVLSLVGAALGLLLLSVAPTKPPFFLLALIGATLLSAAATPTITMALVSETFDRGRGLALGAVSAFTGLGVALLPLTDTWLIGQWGWRATYCGLGGLVLVAALLNLMLLRNVSSHRSSVSDAAAAPMTALLRDRTFWIIAGFAFLLAVIANAIPLHLPLILQERGATPEIRALSLTLTGFTMIVTRPLLGWAVDQIPLRWVLSIMVAGPLIGSLGLLGGGGTLGALVSAVGFGVAIGGEFVCLGYMVSRGFPLKRFGAIYGWLSLALSLGVALGPVAVSALVETSGGYRTSLMMMVGASLLALLFVTLLNESRFRAEGSTAAAASFE